MATLYFGAIAEQVVTREEFTLEHAREVLKDEVVAIIGYGVQGPGQALNLRDNGITVIVGQRKNSKSWDKAIHDGFVPGSKLKTPPASLKLVMLIVSLKRLKGCQV